MMVDLKELEWELYQMVIEIICNGIFIKLMAVENRNAQMVVAIGGNTRMV